MDRFDLYELCVQTPGRDAAILAAIHGGSPRMLGEDFSGAAALSRAWCDAIEGARAVAVDHDPAVIARIPPTAGLTARCCSVVDAADRVDLIAATNFGVCEMTTRAGLLGYLRWARSRLTPGGVLACDLYGGADAMTEGTYEQEMVAADGSRVVYTWEQRRADAMTGLVTNAMHFSVSAPDGTERDWRDAFVYEWRLWSIAELRDAMDEAGFARTEVFDRCDHAVDQDGAVHVRAIVDGEHLDDNYQVLVVGRV